MRKFKILLAALGVCACGDERSNQTTIEEPVPAAPTGCEGMVGRWLGDGRFTLVVEPAGGNNYVLNENAHGTFAGVCREGRIEAGGAGNALLLPEGSAIVYLGRYYVRQ